MLFQRVLIHRRFGQFLRALFETRAISEGAHSGSLAFAGYRRFETRAISEGAHSPLRARPLPASFETRAISEGAHSFEALSNC